MDDSDPRRRNLIVLSLIIIFYFVSGVHFEPNQKITIGFTSAIIDPDKQWVIFATTWIMFFWFWWQYRINIGTTLREDFISDIDLSAEASRDLQFRSSLNRFAVNVIGKQRARIEKLHPDTIKYLSTQEYSPSSSFLSGELICNIKTRSYLKMGSDKESGIIIRSPLLKIRLFCIYIRHRPGFSDIAAPQCLAATAVAVAIAYTYPLLFVLPALALLFVILNTERLNQKPQA